MNHLLPPAHLDAASEVRASRSSFAPAFRLLPSARRHDLEILYAFCRRVDDLADDAIPGPGALRLEALAAWRDGFRDPGRAGLPDNLREMVQRRRLDPAIFLELLEGVATDLSTPVRMPTRADLDLYCHRVAGTVGLLCLPIFGANPQRAAAYAETLGRALQYTNILRDTASDWQRGRLYYALDELAADGIDADDFFRRDQKRQAFLQRFAAENARLYAEAARLQPADDRRALRPARLMGAVYAQLLGKMLGDGLRVVEVRYRLSTAEKITALAAALLRRQ
ncbi:MAG: phytoene/squalene synthase family protein [Chthoniobacterales bacterium]